MKAKLERPGYDMFPWEKEKHFLPGGHVTAETLQAHLVALWWPLVLRGWAFSDSFVYYFSKKPPKIRKNPACSIQQVPADLRGESRGQPHANGVPSGWTCKAKRQGGPCTSMHNNTARAVVCVSGESLRKPQRQRECEDQIPSDKGVQQKISQGWNGAFGQEHFWVLPKCFDWIIPIQEFLRREGAKVIRLQENFICVRSVKKFIYFSAVTEYLLRYRKKICLVLLGKQLKSPG